MKECILLKIQIHVHIFLRSNEVEITPGVILDHDIAITIGNTRILIRSWRHLARGQIATLNET